MFERDKAERRHTQRRRGRVGEGGARRARKARSGDRKRGKLMENGECSETVEQSATRGQ